jgi:hypothetical protein
MAHGTRGPAGQTTVAQANAAPHGSNGVLTSGEPSTAASVNRKKQKRRQKELAKRQADEQASQDRPSMAGMNVNNIDTAHTLRSMADHISVIQDREDPRSSYDDYDDQDQYEDEYYSEDAAYNDQYDPAHPNGYQQAQAGAADKKSKKKQKKGKAMAPDPYSSHSHSHAHPHSHNHAHAHPHPHPHNHGRMYARDTHAPPPPPPPPPPSMSSAALRTVQRSANTKGDRIWNTSTQEERENIKEFWLSLGEDERKSLVKIEKEAVLRKMKEQQKHSCSCTVCGRKRTAIEEELEVLYDAYYEELEQYVHISDWTLTGPRFRSLMHDNQHESRLPPDRMTPIHYPPQPSHGHIEELPDDDDDEEDDADDEDYSDEEEDYDEDEYSDEEPEELPRPSADFFNFGNSLTVKGKPILSNDRGQISHSSTGGILTVADDLLKNDGKKFIEMMEQLAERRMQREEEAQYAAAAHPTSYRDNSYQHNHGPAPEDDYDDDDEEDYDSQEDDEYDEEEEDMVWNGHELYGTVANMQQDTMTEEQRMQEGRRMFQIFAARMFEQRVLTAYREKVARERQQKLLEELDEEKTVDAAREAKKARDAEKKKQKKQAQKQKLAEEKARKEAEKAAEEAAVREAEQKRQEELKKRREEQRAKKEEQRKAQEAEIARKNAEKLKRQKEEQDRRQETERKAREQKEAERKTREEAKKKEREEREAREREAKERKAKSEKERKDREVKEKTEKDAFEKSRKESHTAQQAHAVQQVNQASKRAVAPAPVPLPPGLQKHPSSYSPHVSVATPVIPKAPTPVRPRQGSQQGSKGSSPKAVQVAIGHSKAGSPPYPGPGPIAPKTILSRPPSQPPVNAAHPGSPMHGIPPPPGMPIPHSALFGMPNMNGYSQNQGPMMPQRTMSQNLPGMFSPQAPIGSQFRPFPPNGMPGPPPGMGAGMPPMGRGFPDAPPGFPQQMSSPGFGAPVRETMPAHSGMPQQHSRQQSGSSNHEPPNAIQRPAPGAIQRPSSVKPQDGRLDIDDLSRHLGSSALLDDDESPEPPSFQDRRPSMMAPGLPRGGSNLSSAFGSQPLFTNAVGPSPFGINTGNVPGNTWGAPSNPFGQSSVPSGNGWGPSPTSTWGPNSLPFGNNAFGNGAVQGLPSRPRPHQIRVNMCKACQTLTKQGQGNAEGFHAAISILNHIQNSMQPPVTEDELDMMLTTEGTQQNGGGSFQVLQSPGQGPLGMLIKWIPSDSSDGLPRMGSHGVGEIGGGIGSPIVGPRDPVSANATPFGSMRGFPVGGMPGLGGLGSSGL